MNKELLQRIKTAGEYQRKAVYALFPEEMSGHLGVLEKELRTMTLEAVMAFWKKNGSDADEPIEQSGVQGNGNAQETGGVQGTGSAQAKKVRKVEITA